MGQRQNQSVFGVLLVSPFLKWVYSKACNRKKLFIMVGRLSSFNGVKVSSFTTSMNR